MRVFKNILIAVGILFGAVAFSIVLNVALPPSPGSSGWTTGVVWLAIIATSLWASIVSSRLEFQKYKSALSNHPVVIFIGHIILWIVVFPWFLTVRDQINDGTAELKGEFKGAPRPVSASARKAPQGSMETPQAIPELVPPPLPAVMPRKPAPVPAPSVVKTDSNRLEQLQKLADFKDQGVLTDEEFQAEKRRLLG